MRSGGVAGVPVGRVPVEPVPDCSTRTTYQCGEALERLAALQAPGSAGSSLLQTISGQLVSYQSQVEQADAEYRRDIALEPPAKAIWDGLSHLCLEHSARSAGGLLAGIDELAGPGQQALSGQLASPWANRALPLVFAVPALLALSGIAAIRYFCGAGSSGRSAFRCCWPPRQPAGWPAGGHRRLARRFALAAAGDSPAGPGGNGSPRQGVDAEAATLQANPASGGSVASSALNPSATQGASSALDRRPGIGGKTLVACRRDTRAGRRDSVFLLPGFRPRLTSTGPS